MFGIPGPIGTFLDFLVVLVGFGLIIFIHEAGHFIAARWAGIRVMAFALGFGPAAFSYRKGLGWRKGSSETEYIEWLKRRAAKSGKPVEERDIAGDPVSPTEYRLNLLPLGGYVKMLGQDDMNPAAVSTARDSFQNCRPWKRMIVISAGVVMNVITAAVLFIVVFMVGMKVEPPVVGDVLPGSPGASAVAVNAAALGVAEPGLQPGDEIVQVNARVPNTFSDVRLGVAMTARNTPVKLMVRRSGLDQPLDFEIVPEPSKTDQLLSLGLEPAQSLVLSKLVGPAGEVLPASWGLNGIGAGARIVEADGQPVSSPAQLNRIFAASNGQPVALSIIDDGATTTRSVRPRAEVQTGVLTGSENGPIAALDHLLGLVPVMRVADGENAVQDHAREAGLHPGDIFAMIAGIEFPNLADGIRIIRAHKGDTIDLVVLRKADDGFERVRLQARVSNDGRIGFVPADSSDISTFVAMPPVELHPVGESVAGPPPATALISAPGERIVAVQGRPVENFTELREALKSASATAFKSDQGVDIPLTLELPLINAEGGQIERTWELSAADVRTLHELSWLPPFDPVIFEPLQVELKATGPIDAVRTGISETRRVLVTTYVTFARLFQHTVKIEHLKGPVGIAHLGTLLADRGLVWLLFFMAVISVNLAVINFLPLPIVDGGQFLMLVYEQIRGRPVPIPVQNAVTMAGLLLIASLFLIVTFNDVRNLLGF